MSAGELADRARAIRLVVLDVDGVLTDGSIHLGADGQESKVFHVHDGLGIKHLLAAGVQVAVISGRRSEAVTRRMQELGVEHVFQGESDKARVMDRLLRELDLRPGDSAVVGDDLPDLPLFRGAGLAVAVADAHPEVRAGAHWITSLPGGRGAVRELADLLLRAGPERDP